MRVEPERNGKDMKAADELRARIAELPRGSLTVKRVNGHKYHYHRIMENGKGRETYVPEAEASALSEGIEERWKLEKELRQLNRKNSRRSESDGFLCMVLTGKALKPFAEPVKGFCLDSGAL